MRVWSDPRTRTLAGVLLIASAAALGGCYTVLKHPPTAEVADGGERRRDCFDCHQDQGFAQAIDPLYAPAFDYYNDNYYPYYAYPWWYRQFWYYGDSGGSGGGGGSYSGGAGNRNDDVRHVWGRGISTAPTPPPVYTSPGPGPSGPGSSSNPPGGTPDTPGQQPGRTMKKGSEQQSQDKKDPDEDSGKKEDSTKKSRSGKDG